MEKRKKSVIENKRSDQRPEAPQKRSASGKRPTSAQRASQAKRRSSQSRYSDSSSSRPIASGNRQKYSQERQKPVKKNKFFKKVLIVVLILLVGSAGAATALVKFGNLNSDLGWKASKYDISSSAAALAKDHRIVNIAIFGVDGREDVEGERSDSMMIASADFEHGSIKITSIMRDTYCYINEEYGYDKINSAYASGGPEQALKTINRNFDTAISDYVTIDFTSMVEMVNAVGGVDVNIESEDELYWINQYLMDVNDKVKTASPDVPGTGVQTLDGSQALSYCRVRYVGNGDFDRTQRQRTVMEQVLQKAFSLSPLAQYNLIMKVMPYVQTSLSTTEILKYAGNTLLMSNHSILQSRLPVDEYVETGMLYDVSYVFPLTLVDNIKAWYNFVYEVDYTPSATAQDISDEIQSVW